MLSTVLALCVAKNAEDPDIFMRQRHQSTRFFLRLEQSRGPPRLDAGRIGGRATVCCVTATLGTGKTIARDAGRKTVSTATVGAEPGANVRIEVGEDTRGTDDGKGEAQDAGYCAEAAAGRATGADTMGSGRAAVENGGAKNDEPWCAAEPPKPKGLMNCDTNRVPSTAAWPPCCTIGCSREPAAIGVTGAGGSQ